MKLSAILALCLLVPAAAFAGDAENPTCDACVDIDDTLTPTAVEQVVAGSTVGEANGEYTYSFCAVAGGSYTFSTCDGTTGGGADYDTALSIWEISGDTCGANLACNDDDCSGGSSIFLSTVSFVAPADGNYAIVVDGFSSSEGNYNLSYVGVECEPTPVEESTWGEIKATYR